MILCIQIFKFFLKLKIKKIKKNYLVKKLSRLIAYPVIQQESQLHYHSSAILMIGMQQETEETTSSRLVTHILGFSNVHCFDSRMSTAMGWGILSEVSICTQIDWKLEI